MLTFIGHTALAAPSSQPTRKRDFFALLNQGEGHALLDAYANHRNDPNRNALAMHYSLCAQVVARQIHRGLTLEARRQVELTDVEQTAMALLFQLVEKFDCTLGIPLSAFLVRRLRFAMIDEYRREGLMVRAGRVTIERHTCVELESADRVVDSARSPLEKLIEREGRKTLLRAIPREYRLFVVFRFVRRMQLWQVAKRLNITFEHAERLQAESFKLMGIQTSTPTAQRPSRARNPRTAIKPPATGVLPIDLQRDKQFRGWFLRRVPWAYRKLVAYRYLRGRDIDWTAGKLGICPSKARLLDRQARPMMLKVVQEYRLTTDAPSSV
ncbi:MAG TPA: sigma-70 family RNA polymerase sigma factor [Tepidisphaeraceae bacterium]|nr:sigma-70 family RNA polymerase sigma factor [Tepidisphaeraceae bacterium]